MAAPKIKKGGYLITFEGIEGVGKSTQIEAARALLEARYPGKVTLTREPGGTAAGERIRDLLLQERQTPIAAMTELLLFFAARAQHLEEVILPALAAGKLVLCDRFTDASYAYQGAGRALGRMPVMLLEALVQDALRPNLTLLLDAPVKVALERILQRDPRQGLNYGRVSPGPGNGRDRFESEQKAFFTRAKKAYLDIAKRSPERVRVIDAAAGQSEVTAAVREVLREKELLP